MNTFFQFYSDVLCEGTKLGLDTSWEGINDEGKKIKVTMRQVLKFLDKNQIPIERIATSKIKSIIIDQDYEGTAKERVEEADLKYPIVIIKSKGKLKSILDGNHRAYKVIKRKNKFISARILDIDSEDAPPQFKELFNYKISPKFSK
jgi:hypothetical protein